MNEYQSTGGGLGGIVSLLFMLAIYAYFAYSIMVLANKTKTPNAWMAWIPVLDVFLLVKVAGKPYWWIILFFIPIVNLIIAIYLWMEIARRRGFESWLGILMIIPFVNFIIPGYLAFAEPKQAQPAAAPKA